MIEGRSGGSGRGTRRELWVPPDSGSAHRRIAGLYRVRRSTRSRSLRRPLISFPPPLPHPRTCLLATGKNSAAPERTFSSALVSAEWRAQRGNDRREKRGIWAGHSKRIVGPTCQRFCSPTDRSFVPCTTLDPKPFPAPSTHFLPSAASSPVVGEEPNLPCLRSSVS